MNRREGRRSTGTHWHRVALMSVVLCCLPMGVAAQSLSYQQWRDSLAVLNQQIERSAWSTDLHLRKAAVNLELQQWEYAADEYGLVLQHEEGNLAALFYRAYANSRLRRYELSRSDYEDLLARLPRHLEARLGLAYIHQVTGFPEKALDQLNQAVEMHPDSAVAYVARAALEREMRLYDAALYDWASAIRLSPQEVDYVASYADLLIALERRDEARRALDEAVGRGVPRGLLQKWYQLCR